MDVQIAPEWSYAGMHYYSVWVDGVKYDEFTSRGWLTASQLYDVAQGYKEGLE